MGVLEVHLGLSSQLVSGHVEAVGLGGRPGLHTLVLPVLATLRLFGLHPACREDRSYLQPAIVGIEVFSCRGELELLAVAKLVDFGVTIRVCPTLLDYIYEVVAPSAGLKLLLALALAFARLRFFASTSFDSGLFAGLDGFVADGGRLAIESNPMLQEVSVFSSSLSVMADIAF